MKKPRVMYMHTLDGKPARVIRWSRGRVSMVKHSRRVRLPLFDSLAQIREQQAQCVADAMRQSRREYPMSPRDVHERAGDEMLRRLGYVLVEIPS